jgi:hypothetical protein
MKFKNNDAKGAGFYKLWLKVILGLTIMKILSLLIILKKTHSWNFTTLIECTQIEHMKFISTRKQKIMAKLNLTRVRN